MKFPPHIFNLLNQIKDLVKIPGEWNIITKALSTYYNLILLDKDGWRFYAVRNKDGEGELRSVHTWNFSSWDEEEELIKIINEKEES